VYEVAPAEAVQVRWMALGDEGAPVRPTGTAGGSGLVGVEAEAVAEWAELPAALEAVTW
jgi:hypothetical protein